MVPMTLITISRVVEKLVQSDEVEGGKTNEIHRNSSKKPTGGKSSDWILSEVDSSLFSGFFSSDPLLKKRGECRTSTLVAAVLGREPDIQRGLVWTIFEGACI